MATIERVINRFDGGITNDPRSPLENVNRIVTNFDILTDPQKLIPYRSSESGDSAASTSKKQNFCVALRTGTTYRLYGLGVKSGETKAEILMKDLTTTSSDLADDAWLTPNNNQSSNNATSFNLFVYYKKTALIYGAENGNLIWTFDPTSSAAFSSASQAITYTNIAQGLVHSKDDILYVPYDNKIAKNDNGSWSTTALTLPSHLYITSICEYGNYLAIGCSPLSGVGESQVYLWDRDSSLATLSETINWGSGNLKVLEEVDGYLIGVSLVGNSTTTLGSRVVFKYLNGTKAEKFKEIIATTTTSSLPIAKQKIDNKLYFMLSFTINGSVRDGVWSIGRSSPTAPFALSHERTPNNNTALSGGSLLGFFIVGDFMFISYISSSANALSKTSDTSTAYAHNSTIETKKFVAKDTEKLLGVTIDYEPQDGGTVAIKYKIQGESSYTTIFTHTATTTTRSHSAINIESSGANLPQYEEIEFQIISTGGVVITEWSFKSEEVSKRMYE